MEALRPAVRRNRSRIRSRSAVGPGVFAHRPRSRRQDSRPPGRSYCGSLAAFGRLSALAAPGLQAQPKLAAGVLEIECRGRALRALDRAQGGAEAPVDG